MLNKAQLEAADPSALPLPLSQYPEGAERAEEPREHGLASASASEPTMLGIPVRLDSTLCDRDEVWLEGPDGTVEKI